MTVFDRLSSRFANPKWRRVALILAGVVVVIAAGLAIVASRLSPYAKDKVVHMLEDRFDSKVQLSSLDVSLFPSVSVSGEGLVFHHKGRTDVPPLITLKHFSANTSLFTLLVLQRVGTVRLEGLKIQVPPRGKDNGGDERPENASPSPARHLPVVVEKVIADGTELYVLPKDPGKQPMIFTIRALTLRSVGVNSPMDFKATLMNAKPPGEIQTTGQFGPWQQDDPGLTAVSGKYTFQNAQLGIFKGISGTLSSTGEYKGILSKLNVQGVTDTPNFVVTPSGYPVHLKTEFTAVVDGTDGDTLLQPVVGHFLNSTVVARGGVVGKKGENGKTVTLDIDVKDGRLEDMLRLAVKSEQPVLTGRISYQAKMKLPPGDREVAQKLSLDGVFGVSGAQFTSSKVQQQIESFSQRAKGHPEVDAPGTVASSFKGRFRLENGVITLHGLSFRLPGAVINLDGTYGILKEEMDFHGTATLEAKVSETVTGIKSIFLKALDPLFSKKGKGAVIPIRITGTRSQPSFGLDVGRTLNRR